VPEPALVSKDTGSGLESVGKFEVCFAGSYQVRGGAIAHRFSNRTLCLHRVKAIWVKWCSPKSC